MTEKLQSCPFYGSKAKVIEEKKENTTKIYIECNECFCLSMLWRIGTGE